MSGATAYSGLDPFSGEGRTLCICEGVIRSSEPCVIEDLPILSPGLIDLQVNGYNGHDLNEGVLKPTEVEALSASLCRVGVAAFLPTLITASADDLCQRLSAIREACETLPHALQMIAGIHVEGPSISDKDGPRGAHPIDHVRPPSLQEFERWQTAAGGLLRMITIAPEVEGALDYIREVSARGVIVSIGHSDASEEHIIQAAESGARLSTHLGNGIAATLPRHPNAIWAQLAEDRLSASLILDGHHLPRSTALAMLRAKGIERVVLVSDCVKFAGLAAGRYSSPVGGEVVVTEDRRVSMAGTPYLAGCGMSLMDILGQFTRFTSLPFADGLTMATANPARVLNRSVDLNPGDRADFILFDLDQNTGNAMAREIIFGGERVMS